MIIGLSNSEEIALAADHRGMVKYPSENDPNFQKVLRRLILMINHASDKVEGNWMRWERVKSK